MAVVDRFSADLKHGDSVRISAEYAGPASLVAIVVICHGVCEHRGRYKRVIERFCDENVACISFDLRGHGSSSGKRGHVESFEEYLVDLHLVKSFRDLVVAKIGFRGKCFLMGHSLGGVIVTRYLQEQGKDAGYSGVLLSSPGFVTAVPVSPYKRFLAAIVRTFFSSLRVPTGINASAISTDLEEQQAYATDPRVTSKVSLQWFKEFERSGRVALCQVSKLTTPLYVFYGSADTVVSGAAIEQFVEAVGAKDKTVRCWPGLRHETLNEKPEERERVFSELLGWLKAHL